MTNYLFKPKGSRMWRWKFRLRREDGKIQDVALGTTDKQVAEKFRSDLLKQKEDDRAGFIPPKATRDAAHTQTVRPFARFPGRHAAAWQVGKVSGKPRISCWQADCGLRWNTAKDVSADSFQGWLRGRQELKDKTANDYLEAARCFFNWLVKLGRAASNPLLSVEKVKSKEGKADEVRAFSDERNVAACFGGGWRAQDGLPDGGAYGPAERRNGGAQVGDLHLDAVTRS
jgi:hypothetical protein